MRPAPAVYEEAAAGALGVARVQALVEARQIPDSELYLGPRWVEQRWEVPRNARLLPQVGADDVPLPGLGWWVPYGEGWEIPAGFEYSGSGPFDWAMWIQVWAGAAECVAVKAWRDDGRPVRAAALRRFPIGRLVKVAVLLSSRPADEIPKRYVRWASEEEAKAARRDVAEAHASRTRNPRERQPTSRELLARVAEIYRAEMAGGAPTRAVAEKLNYSRASAGRLVMKARKAGLLPATEQRKAQV